MSEPNLFTDIPPFALIYFFYGLTFFFLGVSIAVKEMKGSELKLAGSLWLLAAFGFLHGSHEWLELYLLLQGRYIAVEKVFYVRFITVFTVVLSFLFLLQFGLLLTQSIHNNRMRWLKGVPVILLFIWLIPLWSHGFSMDIPFFEKADIRARNIFGFVGGLITAYGLITYSYE